MSEYVCELAAAGRLGAVSTFCGVAEGATSSNAIAGCPAGFTTLPVPDLMWEFVLNKATWAATLMEGDTKSGACLEMLGRVVRLQGEQRKGGD